MSPGVSLENENILKKDEIITEVLLPTLVPEALSSYRKVRAVAPGILRSLALRWPGSSEMAK